MNKIILINLWIGEIPDYFKYHYETAINNKNVDFLLITDQKINLGSSTNYKILNINKDDLKNKISNTLNIDYNFSNNKNICQLKCALADIFSEEVKNYLYWGMYDIDTLFGDFNKFIIPHIYDDLDIISFGALVHHDRISGPLMIIKNTIKNNTLYKLRIKEFVHKLYNYEVDSFDETEFNSIVNDDNSIKVLILHNVCNFSEEKGTPLYEAYYSGGKLFINNDEKLIHHFIDKENINFYQIGNSISSFYKKDLVTDFYWVTGFSENYEKIANVLLESISKFSSRKCIIYTINYTSKLSYQKNEQFIFRRIDLSSGEKDESGRDKSVVNSKPNILSDVIDFKPKDNFVFVDTDIYLTSTADNIIKYFQEVENYPLINSHVHDRIYDNRFFEKKKWISTLEVLSEKTKIPIAVSPQRKYNVIVFNGDSKWFFDEQIKIYERYKNDTLGTYGQLYYDEDSSNILLSKYNFKKSLPIVDIEESTFVDIEKFNNYSYNMTPISANAILPKNKNEILFFHGAKVKEIDFIQKISNDHLPYVIEHDRFIVGYNDNTFSWKKCGFLTDKKILTPVHFRIKNINGDILYELNNQDLYRYWLFYIGNCFLEKGDYIIQIEDSENNIIFNKIKNII